MLLFNKSTLITLVLTLNFATNAVVADFSNVLEQIGEAINNSASQPQQQQQQQQHESMNHKVMLSDEPPENQESNENFEALLGNGLSNRDGINSMADGLFGKIPNPLCLFPGACPSTSSKVPVPSSSSQATTPTSATTATTVTSKSSVIPPIIPTSYPPIFPTSATPTTATTITGAVTTTTSSEKPKPTDASNTDWGSLAQLFFNLFKTLVEAILKAIKGDK